MTAKMQVRIVVIDDDPDLLMVLGRLLERDGHAVWTAEKGSDGVELVRFHRPDLVLCDLSLAGSMDGYQVARDLRANPLDPPPLLVALSGLDAQYAGQEAVRAGFDRMWTKSYDIREIPVRIATLLREDPAFGSRA